VTLQQRPTKYADDPRRIVPPRAPKCTSDEVRNLALDHFNISYGTSFGPFSGKYFRTGHLGDTNDLTILGALAGTEMALMQASWTTPPPHRKTLRMTKRSRAGQPTTFVAPGRFGSNKLPLAQFP
jgi:hypothetical protein